MTPAQKQQLISEIERRSRGGYIALPKHQVYDDVADLLSLVKSQEVDYVCESCGRSDRHTPECPTPAWCPGCGSRVIGHQWNTCHNAAASMRSACVEKVKVLAESWAKSVNEQWEDRPDLSFDAAERLKAAGEIITALESVSIQEQ